MVSQPIGERVRFSVAPHPGREAGERLAGVGNGSFMAHISVNARGVGPVRLDGDEGKAMMADEPLSYRGACAIKFRGPVGGFSEEHNARISEPIKEQGKLIRSLWRGKRFGMITENLGYLAADGLTTAFKCG